MQKDKNAMMHWQPPEARGLYRHPGSQPPTPQPHNSNNLVSRIVRIETYLQYALEDRRRAERESLARAYDLHDRLAVIEAIMTGWARTVRILCLIATWGTAIIKYIAASVLFAMALLQVIPWSDFTKAVGVIGLPMP